MGLVFLIWFAGVSAGLAKAFTFMGVVLGVITFVIYGARYISWADSYDPEPQHRPNFSFTKKVLFSCVAAIIIGSAMPDQKTVYYMGGAYLGVKAVQSETGNKVVEMVNKKIDQYIAEMETFSGEKVEEKK